MFKSSTIGLSTQEDIRNTRDTVMVAIAGFTVLVWDHLVTFSDEVELIWLRGKGPLVYLFLLNRYLTPLGFIVNLLSHFPTGELNCQHFVRYEGAMTVIGIQIVGLMMFLRIRALYHRNKAIVWGIILLWLIWLGVNAWLLANGEAVQHASMVHSCSMIFNASLSNIASASAWLPLLYDTCIFALTLYKTKCRSGHLVRTLLSDGILYYSLICTVNVVLTIMIVRAGQGVKNITAQLELLLTVAMMSRITLNLRKQALLEDTIFVCSGDWTPKSPQTMRTGSVSAAGTRSRVNAVGSTMPLRNSITFRVEPASYPEHLRLSTIYSIDLTPEAMTPAAASPVSDSEEGPRFKRPGVEGDIVSGNETRPGVVVLPELM